MQEEYDKGLIQETWDNAHTSWDELMVAIIIIIITQIIPQFKLYCCLCNTIGTDA